MTTAAESVVHAAHELALLPLTLFTFFVYELPKRVAAYFVNFFYALAQVPVIWLFKPPRPPKEIKKPRGRIAVIGAGLTGVSSAAHAVAHGFEVVIYEKSDKVGGIWSSVNKSSGLQLNSFLYRFHPGVKWSRFFPQRDEILGEIRRVWREYNLEQRTRFGTTVTSVRRAPSSTEAASKWLVNDGADGEFDAIIVNIGTCGEPNMVMFPGMPGYKPKGSDKESPSDKEKTKHEDEDREKDKRPAKRRKAWNQVAAEGDDSKAVKHDQEEKKALGFPKPGEVYGSDSEKQESPTQDLTSPLASNLSLPATLGKSNGSTTTVAGGEGPWAPVEEPTWEIGKDQAAKKEQGFPRPDEAYEVGEDPQKDARSPVKSNQDEKATEKVDEASGSKVRKDDQSDLFTKPIVHSSQLTSSDVDFRGKRVVVLGGGASAVESVETALAQGASDTVMVTRQDKWIIPRNSIIDTLIAAQPFGREMPLSFLWERFIGWYNYHGVKDLIPADIGLFEGTPVVNDEFLNYVREGRCKYVRGDVKTLTPRGVKVNVRQRGTKPGDDGDEHEFDADIVVLATGFKKPDVSFLEDELFPEGYDRPNLYLQNFSTEDWSVLMTNSAYMNAIGTVGHFHIGIYARILLTFLMDPNARPTKKDMKLWVDVIRFIKRGASGGALGFFTYMELTIWLLLFHLFRPDRIKWMFFIMQGWGVRPLA